MQPLTLSLVQTATHWHDPARNRQMFETWMDGLADAGQIIVLPEMFSTGFTMSSAEVAETMSGDTIAWLQAQAVDRGRIICGSVVIQEGGEYFNRCVWATPRGDITTYDKRHCFRMAGEHEHYSPGQDRVIVTAGGWRVCLMVCYDLRFPVWFRNREDYDAIVCVANWPAARREAWNTLLRARAIENQCYVAGVNIVGTDGNNVVYSGGSAAYGPDGTILVERFDDPGVLEVSFDPDVLEGLRKDFPVWQDADRFRLEQ